MCRLLLRLVPHLLQPEIPRCRSLHWHLGVREVERLMGAGITPPCSSMNIRYIFKGSLLPARSCSREAFGDGGDGIAGCGCVKQALRHTHRRLRRQVARLTWPTGPLRGSPLLRFSPRTVSTFIPSLLYSVALFRPHTARTALHLLLQECQPAY